MQDISFQAQDILSTYQETISQQWNEIWPFLHGETVASHGQCKWHSFQFLTQEKLWQKSPIINSLLQPCNLTQSWQIAWEYHPTPHTFFTYTYVPLTTLCTKTLTHDTTPPMLPHARCMKLLSDHASFLPPSKSVCHIIQKPTTHSHPKVFSTIPLLTFLALAFNGKFVAALEPQFHFFYASLLALLQIPDRHVSLLHHSSLTFLVYCCFFCFSTHFFS